MNFISLFLATIGVVHSAGPATLSFEPMTTDTELTSLLRFQNIDAYKMKFEGESLVGRSYQIRVKKYVKGVKTLDRVQLDSAELGSLGQVNQGGLTLTLLSQAKDGRAKFDFQTPRFGNAYTYDAPAAKHEYVMRNFLGSEQKLTFDADKETNVLCLMLPTEHADGSASYCEVAGSGAEPEKFWEKFKVPTYFLITFRFQKA